ncbi:hypothetical protein ABZY93_22190 [Streptomyces smyrnaeus]|uniref:hypothetical protein n=1 Tax=Streptomyces smyrnaeus TaxID=1387713 RepID=UPI00339F65E6
MVSLTKVIPQECLPVEIPEWVLAYRRGGRPYVDDRHGDWPHLEHNHLDDLSESLHVMTLFAEQGWKDGARG